MPLKGELRLFLGLLLASGLGGPRATLGDRFIREGRRFCSVAAPRDCHGWRRGARLAEGADGAGQTEHRCETIHVRIASRLELLLGHSFRRGVACSVVAIATGQSRLLQTLELSSSTKQATGFISKLLLTARTHDHCYLPLRQTHLRWREHAILFFLTRQTLFASAHSHTIRYDASTRIPPSHKLSIPALPPTASLVLVMDSVSSA